MTLDDLERPKRTLAEKIRFMEVTRKIWMNTIIQLQKCRPMILISRNIGLKVYADIRKGVSNDSGVIELEDGKFKRFRWLFVRKL